MKKPKILIADDDKNLRIALGKRLTSWGYSVVESHDGLNVVGQCHREAVEAMILDYEMPNGDGQTIARMLRHESDVPIVFVSGHDREEFRGIVSALPDVYYLSKPIDHERLRSLLKKLIATPRAELRSV